MREGIEKENKINEVLKKYREVNYIDAKLEKEDQDLLREWRKTREAWKVIEYARVDKLFEVMNLLKVPYLYKLFF